MASSRKIDEDLLQAVKDNDVKKAARHLEEGANVNAGVAPPLLWAAYQGNERMVALLLEAGADIEAVDNDGKFALDFAFEEGHPGVISQLEEAKRERRSDEVIVRHKISDRTLEEVFSFTLLERVSLLRNGDQVEAFIREPFTELSDQSSLRRAFEEHRRRGGTVAEEAVFGNELDKRLRSAPLRLKPEK